MPELLTIAEARARLRCSHTKAYDLIRRGEIATVKVDRRRLVVNESIDAYIERHVDLDAAVGPEAVRRLVESSRSAQGLPPTIEDSAALEQTAAIVRGASKGGGTDAA